MNEADRKKAAGSLLQAERERKPVVQFATAWPGITIEDAADAGPIVGQASLAIARLAKRGDTLHANFGSLGSLSIQFV